MWFVLVALVALGCATPYQRQGFSGGYTDQQLEPGRYMITVRVNSYTSRTTAIAYSYRRAAELCPAGFDPIDADRETSDFYIRNSNGTYYNAPKSSAMLVVQCKTPKRDVAEAEVDDDSDKKQKKKTKPKDDEENAESSDNEDKSDDTDDEPRAKKPASPAQSKEKGFWCTSRGEFGVCFKKPSACKLYRSEITSKHCASNLPDSCAMAMGACAERERATCGDAGCYTTGSACADAERQAGRDGSDCVVRD